uniref:Uncharacterized protein n=1 Tax=Peronospora matthiolae TaxID=2874970 RepID=A0AAV1TSB8_9STRA
MREAVYSATSWSRQTTYSRLYTWARFLADRSDRLLSVTAAAVSLALACSLRIRCEEKGRSRRPVSLAALVVHVGGFRVAFTTINCCCLCFEFMIGLQLLLCCSLWAWSYPRNLLQRFLRGAGLLCTMCVGYAQLMHETVGPSCLLLVTFQVFIRSIEKYSAWIDVVAELVFQGHERLDGFVVVCDDAKAVHATQCWWSSCR